ncbi:MAG TPA: hypothetical protein V6D07_03070 [Trichocoleus sp.]
MTTLRISYSPSADTVTSEAPATPRRRLPHRWSHGRGYIVIALLAPVVLTSVLLIHLHANSQRWLRSTRSNVCS